MATRPMHTAQNRSMADVLQDIIANVQEIIRSEFQLAKAEVKEEAAKAGKSSVPLAAGLIFAFYAIGFLLLGGVYALELTLAPWLSALIVGAAVLILAMILISIGRKRLKQVKVVPEKTVETVKENVQWAKSQIR
jgi:uncharacterized membrane protein YqjE